MAVRPWQMVVVPVMDGVGAAFSLTLAEMVFVQPNELVTLTE